MSESVSKFKISAPLAIPIEIDGKEYLLKKPSLGVTQAFEEALLAAKAANAGSAEVYIKYLMACKLPEEVTKELDTDQLLELLGAINSAKKN